MKALIIGVIVAVSLLFSYSLARISSLASREEEEQWNNEQTHKKDN